MLGSEGAARRITVVGAGPVGSLLAVFLARRGFEVDLYERRPDMRRTGISAGRSINLAVSTRGLHALRQIGLEEEILKQAVPMRGRMMHSKTGELTFQPYGMNDRECINSISRGGLNKSLMTAAEATGKVRIHFNQRATAYDPSSGRIEFRDERTGHETAFEAPVLIGTDGSASAIRAALMELPGHECAQRELDYGYKELTLPAALKPNAEGSCFRMEKHALHIWPRGAFMLIALPNFDGSYTCTLFLPFKGPVSFEGLDTAPKMMRFFRENFGDAASMIPDLEEAFFAHPTGHMVTVKSRPWNQGGRALLVGDAAHAIVPFFGQGMNCGFEDCTLLDSILDQATSWEEAFERFSRARKDDADAIADMAVENFAEMRDKVADPRFLLQKQVEKALQEAFPGEYLSRYALVTFSRVPYRLAWDVGVASDGILAELCAGIQTPTQVDLERAGKLIRERLTPILARRKEP